MFVFDIETGPLADTEALAAMIPPFDPAEVKTGNLKDPEKIAAKISEAESAHYETGLAKAALSAMTGEVLAIGLLDDDPHDPRERPHVLTVTPSYTETDLLWEFWDWIADMLADGKRVVGHNLFGFDLPFLIRRSWAKNVTIPEPCLPQSGRYWSNQFVDTMRHYCLGDSREFVKLDTLAKWLGVGAKTEGIGGGHFAELFRSADPGARDKAIAYLENDVVLTHAVAKKLGVR